MMKNEYKLQARYGHTHKFVSINGNGNPYAFVPEEDWMPLYYNYNTREDGTRDIATIDTEGGPLLYAGWSNDEVEVERITDNGEFILKEK